MVYEDGQMQALSNDTRLIKQQRAASICTVAYWSSVTLWLWLLLSGGRLFCGLRVYCGYCFFLLSSPNELFPETMSLVKLNMMINLTGIKK